MTKVNIYYGGRGLIEDPTIYVMNKITEVLNELNVVVQRYNLYEDKKGISVLPKTLKEADAIILAASVEWFGIGGLLQQFLDACFLYGDKKTLQSLYMMPVVLSTTYGERDAALQLTKAWDLLGGHPCDGISAYVADHEAFEAEPNYKGFIEKRVELFYRTFSGKICTLPSSDNLVQDTVSRPSTIDLTPQESEQLSEYVSNDNYVKKQKEDIQELSEIFRNLLGDEPIEAPDNKDTYIDAFSRHFHSMSDTTVCYALDIMDEERTLYLLAADQRLTCSYKLTEVKEPDVSIKIKSALLKQIITGRTTLQTAFRQGNLVAKGDFKILRTFDELFRFA
ncbi:MAG: SCP2 sterol-binding domain-containing protein [Lachnospiraceae bacterium]|nr:SCP2 sterol-binding domain-containing protein [Lachnospiraceae bacterium]